MRIVNIILYCATMFAGLSFAGDFSIRENEARDLSDQIRKCIKDKNAQCLVSRAASSVELDAPDRFGCITTNPKEHSATPQEFAKCVLSPTSIKNRLTFQEIILDCLSPKAKYEWEAFQGKKRYSCSVGWADEIGSEIVLKRVSSVYVRPSWMDQRYEHLEDATPAELRRLRNEIYARHGRIFQSQDLQEFFSQTTWYKGNPNYSDSQLSDEERRVALTISELEKQVPPPAN